jgi:hypothetical protein
MNTQNARLLIDQAFAYFAKNVHRGVAFTSGSQSIAVTRLLWAALILTASAAIAETCPTPITTTGQQFVRVDTTPKFAVYYTKDSCEVSMENLANAAGRIVEVQTNPGGLGAQDPCRPAFSAVDLTPYVAVYYTQTGCELYTESLTSVKNRVLERLYFDPLGGGVGCPAGCTYTKLGKVYCKSPCP